MCNYSAEVSGYKFSQMSANINSLSVKHSIELIFLLQKMVYNHILDQPYTFTVMPKCAKTELLLHWNKVFQKFWGHWFQLNIVQSTIPCPGGVRNTAFPSAVKTLCSASPILSLPPRERIRNLASDCLQATNMPFILSTFLFITCKIIAWVKVQN